MARVLVTGSSGCIGRAVVAELARCGHAVRGFDRVPWGGLAETEVGELTDRVAVGRAMAGVECLVHLAATPDDADFLTELLPANIVGFHHVMEAARRSGVGRVVLASSGQVTWWQHMAGGLPVRPTDPPSPRSWYAATKVFMESVGRSFAEMHGMSVIVARLGWCPRTPEHAAGIAAEAWAKDVYLSPADAGRFFAAAVVAPSAVRHAVVYVSSLPVAGEAFDLGPAREVLGWEPLDRWPEGVLAGLGG
jgi:nucleoside-diphosphate-sugar epimerase